MKKGWTGYVRGYKNYLSNWDQTFGKNSEEKLGCKKCDKIVCECKKD